MVDGAGDDVARGQFAALVEARHETLAQAAVGVGRVQGGAFAAQRLGDEEGTRVAVVQAGRMELHEFHVRHPAAGAPGHGDAVAGGAEGIA